MLTYLAKSEMCFRRLLCSRDLHAPRRVCPGRVHSRCSRSSIPDAIRDNPATAKGCTSNSHYKQAHVGLGAPRAYLPVLMISLQRPHAIPWIVILLRQLSRNGLLGTARAIDFRPRVAMRHTTRTPVRPTNQVFIGVSIKRRMIGR
jgi:hypothetical protein